MSPTWLDILGTIATQHVWQGALLLLLAWLVAWLHPLGADARSWLWLVAFGLAATTPLLVLLPGDPSPGFARAMPTATLMMGADGDAAPVIATARGLADGMPFGTFALLAWLLGFAWSLARLLLGWRAARRLARAARPAPMLERLVATELPPRTSLRLSNAIASPMVVGLRRPAILVPDALADGMPEATLRDILRHEIAHVRRRDLQVTLVQRLLLAFYWWSPLLRLIGSRLDLAREMACDERAARRSGARREYARSLLRGAAEAFARPGRVPLLASGIFGTRTALARRVESLLEIDAGSTTPAGARPALLACAFVFATGLGLALALTPRLGHTAFEDNDDEASAAQAAPLVHAADAGRLDDVRRLVRAGSPVDARLPGEGTALIVAARNGDLPMVKALLEMGASVDLASSRDGNPLVMAAQAGHHDVVDALIEAGADVNATVRYDETPLINASRFGHLEIVQCLVEKGADVNLAVRADFGVRSPLNQAGSPAIRDYLLQMGARADGA